MAVGVPRDCIHDKRNFIPGFYRASKNWDFMVTGRNGRVLVLIELKSQVGSYGNNFNNRAEESIGNAVDLWTACRDDEFPACLNPWVGYMMIVGRSKASTVSVRNPESSFKVLPEFMNASYEKRYAILGSKLVRERLYNAVGLLWTESPDKYGEIDEEISVKRFISSLQGFLVGCNDEFDK